MMESILKLKSKDIIKVGDPVIVKPKWNGEPTVYVYHSHGILRRFIDWVFSCKQKSRYKQEIPFGIADRDADEGEIVGIRLCGRFSISS